MLLSAYRPAPPCRWTSAAGPRRACLAGCPAAGPALAVRAAVRPPPLARGLLLLLLLKRLLLLLRRLVPMRKRPVRPWPRARGRRRGGSSSAAAPPSLARTWKVRECSEMFSMCLECSGMFVIVRHVAFLPLFCRCSAVLIESSATFLPFCCFSLLFKEGKKKWRRKRPRKRRRGRRPRRPRPRRRRQEQQQQDAGNRLQLYPQGERSRLHRRPPARTTTTWTTTTWTTTTWTR